MGVRVCVCWWSSLSQNVTISIRWEAIGSMSLSESWWEHGWNPHLTTHLTLSIQYNDEPIVFVDLTSSSEGVGGGGTELLISPTMSTNLTTFSCSNTLLKIHFALSCSDSELWFWSIKLAKYENIRVVYQLL